MPERYRPRRPDASGVFQTSFLAPDEATALAEMRRVRLIMDEFLSRYGRYPRNPDGTPSITIRSPRDIADLLMADMQELEQEEFRTVLLTSKNGVIDVPTIYKGTLNSAVVRVAEVLRPALLANAASFIAVHCHPSGDPTPSPEDVRVTAELVRAGQLFDIDCLDHVIIGKGSFVSLKERGLGFT
jgi:DNA repair protein RadC